MNRIERKETIADTAKIFQGEVLGAAPDISRKELCDMVDDYLYYQSTGVSKEEAHAVVDVTCRMVFKDTEAVPRTEPDTVRKQAQGVEVRPILCS